MISILFSFMLVQTEGQECLQYEEVEITECQNTTLKNGLIGGAAGSVAGYLLGGKNLAILGGLAGGGTGLATGKKTCTTHKEKECVKWKSRSRAHSSEDKA